MPVVVFTQNSEILPHTHMWCFTRVKTPLNDLYKTRLSSQPKKQRFPKHVGTA